MAHDHAVLKRVGVKQAGGDRHQRVEPAAGLVDGLGDEVCREAALKLLLVLKRIVPLGERHGAGVVPAVDDFLLAVHFAAALRTPEHDIVDVRAVQLDVADVGGRHLAQLLLGADDVDVAALAGPHRQRGAPVALAGEAPVDDVVKEVAHTAFLDVVRHPVDGAVVLHQLIVHGGHLDEPALAGVVDQRGVAAPAERIVVRERHGGEQQAARLEILEHQRVGVLDEHARPLGVLGHPALAVDEVDERHVVLAADAVVVLAERRRDVDDAGAVAHGDVLVAHDEPGLLLELAHGEVKQRDVLHAAQVTARHFGEHLNLLAREARVDECLGHDDDLTVHGELAVGVVRVDAQREVARQGPRGGRPREEVGVVLALDRKANVRGGLLHVLVALRDLMRGQRSAAARAVRDDLVALVEQALLVDLLEGPPLGLDVVVVVGDVRVFHVRPVADALGHLLPLGLVLPDGLLALLDKRLDAVLLDLRLAVQAEHLLDLQLDRQAVGIPAGLAQHVVALHGAVARDDVLDRAGLHVADVRLAVGRGRAVKEGERGRALAQRHALLENVVFPPEFDDLFLAGDKVHVGRNLLVHAPLPPTSGIVKAASSTLGRGCSRYHPNSHRHAASPHAPCALHCAVTGPTVRAYFIQRSRWTGDPSPRLPSGISPASGSLRARRGSVLSHSRFISRISYPFFAVL